ncbi:hypothetical protein F5887DRAFT_1075600 [Amanita rubescens]|nr:hypothetical protein F5887DRAFT_1075600 [Amanita rubescens]
MQETSKPLPQAVRRALSECKSRLTIVTNAVGGSSKKTAPTKRQSNTIDAKKAAYKKAIEKLYTVSVMHGLTGVTSNFIAENSFAIQNAGLEGHGIASSAANTTMASANSNLELEEPTTAATPQVEKPEIGGAAGAAAAGEDATIAVPEGGQGPEVPAKVRGTAVQPEMAPEETSPVTPTESVKQNLVPPIALANKESLESARGLAVPECALADTGKEQQSDEVNKTVTGKRSWASGDSGPESQAPLGTDSITAAENSKRRQPKKQRIHASVPGGSAGFESGLVASSESEEEPSDSEHEKINKGKRAAAQRKAKSKEALKEYETEESESEIKEKLSKKSNNSTNKNMKLCDLDDEDRQIKEEEVKDAIVSFSNGARQSYHIPTGMRRLIRENQSLAPEAATKSRDLALECLTTKTYNIFCPYHHMIDKAGKIFDGKDGQKYVLNGIPLPRETVHPDAVKVLKKKKSALFTSRGEYRNPRLREGYLNCGCEVDDSLMEFYFEKTWTITGNVNGQEVTESMRDQHLPPRLRAFVTKAFREWTCLTIDDLYTGSLGPHRHQERLYHTQLTRILEKYNALQEELGGQKLQLGEVGDFKVPGPDDDFGGF